MSIVPDTRHIPCNNKGSRYKTHRVCTAPHPFLSLALLSLVERVRSQPLYTSMCQTCAALYSFGSLLTARSHSVAPLRSTSSSISVVYQEREGNPPDNFLWIYGGVASKACHWPCFFPRPGRRNDFRGLDIQIKHRVSCVFA